MCCSCMAMQQVLYCNQAATSGDVIKLVGSIEIIDASGTRGLSTMCSTACMATKSFARVVLKCVFQFLRNAAVAVCMHLSNLEYVPKQL